MIKNTKASSDLKAIDKPSLGDDERAKRKGKTNGSAAARLGVQRPTEQELQRKFKSKYPDASDDSCALYVRSYLEAFDKSSLGDDERAKTQGRINGAQVARKGFRCPTEQELQRKYKSKNPEASDDSCALYARSYLEAFDKSDDEKATKQGITKGFAAARKGLLRPTEQELEGGYKSTYPDATDDRCALYARSYLEAFDKSSLGDDEEEKKQGLTKGARAARWGRRRPTEQDLKRKYKSDNPDATDDRCALYARSYLEAFDKSSLGNDEQAKRQGLTNGSNAAHRGLRRPTEQGLKGGYKSTYPDATDDRCALYAGSYLEAFDKSSLGDDEQAKRRGLTSGSDAARRGRGRPTEQDLHRKYKSDNSDATEDRCALYARSYLEAFDKSSLGDDEQAKRRGLISGSDAARRGRGCPTEQRLLGWYKFTCPDATDDRCALYVRSYLETYNTLFPLWNFPLNDMCIKRHPELEGVFCIVFDEKESGVSKATNFYKKVHKALRDNPCILEEYDQPKMMIAGATVYISSGHDTVGECLEWGDSAFSNVEFMDNEELMKFNEHNHSESCLDFSLLDFEEFYIDPEEIPFEFIDMPLEEGNHIYSPLIDTNDSNTLKRKRDEDIFSELPPAKLSGLSFFKDSQWSSNDTDNSDNLYKPQ